MEPTGQLLAHVQMLGSELAVDHIEIGKVTFKKPGAIALATDGQGSAIPKDWKIIAVECA